MTAYILDEFHIFTVFAFINICLYLSYALHVWHKTSESWICKIVWFANIGLILLQCWNWFFASTTLFNVSSSWMTIAVAILFGIFVNICIGTTIALLQLIVTFGLFMIIVIGGGNYVISIFNQQVAPTKEDYVYVGVILLGLVILWVVYVKFIRGRRKIEILWTDLILSWLVANGVQVLRAEDISTGFNDTTVAIFDYDWIFVVVLVVLFVSYLPIYWYTNPDRGKSTSTDDSEPESTSSEQTTTTTTVEIPSPTISTENTTLLPEPTPSSPPSPPPASGVSSTWLKWIRNKKKTDSSSSH